jgi:phage host-nuclease inhibitor protein Gam
MYIENSSNAVEIVFDDEFDRIADENDAPRFEVTDDSKADWAVRKIGEARAEYVRLEQLAAEQINAIDRKLETAGNRLRQRTEFLTSCLEVYFNSIPHRATKTTEKYKLLSGTLVRKLGGVKPEIDKDALVEWLARNNGYEFIKTTVEPKWGELKQTLGLSGEVAVTADGREVDGVTLTKTPDIFTIETD